MSGWDWVVLILYLCTVALETVWIVRELRALKDRKEQKKKERKGRGHD